MISSSAYHDVRERNAGSVNAGYSLASARQFLDMAMFCLVKHRDQIRDGDDSPLDEIGRDAVRVVMEDTGKAIARLEMLIRTLRVDSVSEYSLIKKIERRRDAI